MSHSGDGDDAAAADAAVRGGSHPDATAGPSLGTPRRHFRSVDSTNRAARELAAAGAVHGTLVTATEQSAGRGRQGRAWSAPPNDSLLMSLVLRDPPPLLSLAAGIAVAETVDGLRGSAMMAGEPSPPAQIKWPNDVMVAGRKLAGILVEGRPQDRWAVLGIGLNVAVRLADLPPELSERAATLALGPDAVEPVMRRLLRSLEVQLRRPAAEVLAALAARDYLAGRSISWESGRAWMTGTAAGIESSGGLIVRTADGGRLVLQAGEVHLGV